MSRTEDELELELASFPPLTAQSQVDADAAEARARWQGGGLGPAPRPPRAYAPPVSTKQRSWLPWMVVALATLLGGGARLATADWGLPYALHVDEKGFVVHEALAAEYRGLTRGDFRPHNTAYGPLVFQLVIATKWARFGGRDAAQALVARYPNEGAYVTQAFTTETTATTVSMPDLLHALRLVAGVLGALTILLLGLTAARLETPRAGAVAATLAAASVGLFQVAHFFTAESVLVFALALFLHACAALATRRASVTSVLEAGVAIALIAASKGPGLVCLVALPAAIASHRQVAGMPPSWWRRSVGLVRAGLSAPMLLSLLVAVLAYAALNPWLVSSDPAAYFRDIAPNRSGAALLALQFNEREFSFYDWRFTYNDSLPFWPHVATLLPYALGGPACLTAYTALGRGLVRRSSLDRIVFWGAIPPLLLVGGFAVVTVRYVLPAVPALILGAASLLAHPQRLLPAPAPSPHPGRPGGSQPPPGRNATLAASLSFALAALAVGIVAFTCARGVAYALMFRQPDPRVLAGRYLAEHGERRDVVVLEPEGSYSAVLNDDYDLVGRVLPNYPAASGGRWVANSVPPEAATLRPRRLFTGRPDQERLPAHFERTLARARFVVVGDWYHRRARHPSAPVRAPAQHAFYRDLFAEQLGFRVVARFTREPRFPDTDWGYVWDEQDEEALSVCFDHMPVTIFERIPDEAAATRENHE